jgi:low affinity Fe/Cu permease
LIGFHIGNAHAWPIRMLFLVVLCIVLWALGMMTTYTLGGLLHILLVVAVVLLLVHVIQGRPIGD